MKKINRALGAGLSELESAGRNKYALKDSSFGLDAIDPFREDFLQFCVLLKKNVIN